MSTQFVKIDSRDLLKVQKGLRQAPRETEKLVERFIAAAHATLAKNTLKDNPVPYDTGLLLSSFRFEKLSKFTARWMPTTNYAYFVDQGTSKMRPRKYMEKIVAKSETDINKLSGQLGDRIAKAIAAKI